MLNHYKTGIQKLDKDIEDLFLIFNLLETVDATDLQSQISKFIEFLSKIFNEEKFMMSSSNYPYIATHMADHKKILKEFELKLKTLHLSKNRRYPLNDIAKIGLTHIEWYNIQFVDYMKSIDKLPKL